MNVQKPSCWQHWLLLVVASALAALSESAALAVSYRTAALSGESAPGAGGATFTEFMIPGAAHSHLVINNSGDVGFYARVAGSGVTTATQSGVWSETAGNLRLVAREGSHAPGTPSGVNFGFGSPFTFEPEPVFSAAGLAAFDGGLSGAGVSTANTGIWSEGGGALHLVARKGAPAPGTASGVTFNLLADPKVDANGRATFLATLAGPGVTGLNERGVWSERSGATQLLVRAGDPAPGAPAGVRFGAYFEWDLNSAGRVAFRGGLTGPGIDYFSGEGVWVEGAGGFELVTRAGQAAPGTEAGVNFFNFLGPALSDSGHVVFTANLAGPDITFDNQDGIWAKTEQGLQLIARKGAHAPGTFGDARFTFFSPPIINNAGQTAFRAQLGGGDVDSSNNIGPWTALGGETKLLLQEGAPAPGVGPDVVFNSFGDPELNSTGQIAFHGTIRGPGVDSSNNFGVWAVGANGLELVARTGQLYEVAPGDQRTIESLLFGTNAVQSFRGMGFNDLGQLAFLAKFTDGSKGIFVADVGAIPEPASTTLLAAGLVVAWSYGRVSGNQGRKRR